MYILTVPYRSPLHSMCVPLLPNSGHGGSVRDLTGDEEDCKDETMVPVDYAKSGQIKDDDILATVSSFLSTFIV